MTFADMEAGLGRGRVDEIQCTVSAACQASCGREEGVRALRELLVGALSAVVTTGRYLPQAQQFAAEDAAQLNALVQKSRSLAQLPLASRAALAGVAKRQMAGHGPADGASPAPGQGVPLARATR